MNTSFNVSHNAKNQGILEEINNKIQLHLNGVNPFQLYNVIEYRRRLNELNVFDHTQSSYVNNLNVELNHIYVHLKRREDLRKEENISARGRKRKRTEKAISFQELLKKFKASSKRKADSSNDSGIIDLTLTQSPPTQTFSKSEPSAGRRKQPDRLIKNKHLKISSCQDNIKDKLRQYPSASRKNSSKPRECPINRKKIQQLNDRNERKIRETRDERVISTQDLNWFEKPLPGLAATEATESEGAAYDNLLSQITNNDFVLSPSAPRFGSQLTQISSVPDNVSTQPDAIRKGVSNPSLLDSSCETYMDELELAPQKSVANENDSTRMIEDGPEAGGVGTNLENATLNMNSACLDQENLNSTKEDVIKQLREHVKKISQVWQVLLSRDFHVVVQHDDLPLDGPQ